MVQTYTLKIQEKGQISLPKTWLNKINVSNLIAIEDGNKLILQPPPFKSHLKMLTENPSFDFLKEDFNLY